MTKALCLLKETPNYRAAAFKAGLEAAGYKVQSTIQKPTPEDVLVIWNRGASNHREAVRFEEAGARVIVAENGYCGRDEEDRQYYAMALDGHNGSGRWYIGEEDRFSKLGLTPAPYRLHGRYILVCGQRGIGSREMRSPGGWHDQVAENLTKIGYTVKVRKHPGQKPPETPLEEDLRDARACVIWASGSGVKALLMGVPVLYAAPHWICEGAAGRLNEIDRLDRHIDDERRRRALHRMAWGQWSVAEIEAGIPFRYLLENDLRKVA